MEGTLHGGYFPTGYPLAETHHVSEKCMVAIGMALLCKCLYLVMLHTVSQVYGHGLHFKLSGGYRNI